MIEQFNFDRVLEPYIKNIWTIENNELPKRVHSLRFFADGYPGVMFQESEGDMFLNRSKKLATLFLYGQTVKPITISTFGNCRIIIIYLYPNVIKSIFGIQANELTDTCLDLNLMPVVTKERTVSKLLDLKSGRDQIEHLQAFMVSLISKSKYSIDVEIQIAVSKLSKPNYVNVVNRVQKELHMSERTFLRKFEQQVGISPKLFSKICRFRRSLGKLESGNYTLLTDIAFDDGYSDQSHFIRSFKEFTGETPQQFLKT